VEVVRRHSTVASRCLIRVTGPGGDERGEGLGRCGRARLRLREWQAADELKLRLTDVFTPTIGKPVTLSRTFTIKPGATKHK
jgi:hypothetical protein